MTRLFTTVEAVLYACASLCSELLGARISQILLQTWVPLSKSQTGQFNTHHSCPV